MIQTSQLTLKAGARVLIDRLDWQVAAGECWSVIGRNGAGKSTLMRTLAGLRMPDSGTVSIQGRALDQWLLAELARVRAFLPQSRSDAFAYRVIETVLAARHPYHANRYWEGSDDELAARAASAWPLPPCWRRIRRCCCSTSRPMHSTWRISRA